MKISYNLFEFEIPSALYWFGHEVGSRLQKRVKGFEQQEHQNPLLGRYYRENYPLEFALIRAWSQLIKTLTFPKADEYNHAYAFAATTKRVYEALPQKAARRFVKRLNGATKDEYGFRPLAFELGIFTHLVRRGYDVTAIELMEIGRFDWLAAGNGIKFEIECKTTSANTGRKIHRRELNRLAHYLLPITKKLVEEGGFHLVRLVLPDRLELSTILVSEMAPLGWHCFLPSKTYFLVSSRRCRPSPPLWWVVLRTPLESRFLLSLRIWGRGDFVKVEQAAVSVSADGLRLSLIVQNRSIFCPPAALA
jgi:hypothetical protein